MYGLSVSPVSSCSFLFVDFLIRTFLLADTRCAHGGSMLIANEKRRGSPPVNFPELRRTISGMAVAAKDRWFACARPTCGERAEDRYLADSELMFNTYFWPP